MGVAVDGRGHTGRLVSIDLQDVVLNWWGAVFDITLTSDSKILIFWENALCKSADAAEDEGGQGSDIVIFRAECWCCDR